VGAERSRQEGADDLFLACLPLIETGAIDERDYVKKGVDMALRALGKRNPALRRAAIDLATRLRDSDRGAQSWVGRSTLRDSGEGWLERSCPHPDPLPQAGEGERSDPLAPRSGERVRERGLTSRADASAGCAPRSRSRSCAARIRAGRRRRSSSGPESASGSRTGGRTSRSSARSR
jgi:hypothetical protein